MHTRVVVSMLHGVLLCAPAITAAGIGSPELLEAMPSSRAFPAAAGTREHVYLSGGSIVAAGSEPVADLHRYTPGTDSWTALAPMPAPAEQHALVHIAGKLYVPGHTGSAETFVYDIASDSWSTLPANGGYTARAQYMAAAHEGMLVVMGGLIAETSSATREVWRLDPETGIWQSMPSLAEARISGAAGSVDGHLVVTGGTAFPGFNPVMGTEILDGGQWVAGPPVPSEGGLYTRWSYNGYASSGDSLWLLAGRRDASWAVLDHIGRLQRTGGTWAWTTSPTLPVLLQPRVYLAAAIREGGGIHVLGGREPSASVSYDIHEFIPLTDIFADGFEASD